MLLLRRDGPSGPGDAKGTWSKGGYRGPWRRGGFKGKDEGIWQADGDEAQGDFDWNQQAEDQTRNETNVVDQDGCQVVQE